MSKMELIFYVGFIITLTVLTSETFRVLVVILRIAVTYLRAVCGGTLHTL